MKYYSEELYLGFVPVALKDLNAKKKSYNTKMDCNKSIRWAEGGTKVIPMWFFIGVALHHISDRAKYHVQPPDSWGEEMVIRFTNKNITGPLCSMASVQDLYYHLIELCPE